MKQKVKKIVFLLLVYFTFPYSGAHAHHLPVPVKDIPLAAVSGEQTMVVAGGCFWGVQAVFQHVKGIKKALSGYAGGAADTASYDQVSSGITGHAEAVQVTYDPSQITLGKILQIYFAVAHNPTELNRQGPDTGTQYRSTIFYADAKQQGIAASYIAQLQEAKVFDKPIMTTLEPLKAFFPAEGYHQGYAELHPYNPYIVTNDLPKIAHLKEVFPELYTSRE